jgi:GT2 family glycosyltransferase
VSQPTIYVVIVNWNGKKLMQQCLSSFFAKTQNPKCKVVVIDNASTDGSTEMIQTNFPAAEIIKNIENAGFSRANNKGIRHALANNAEYVLLLNNDVQIIDEKWLENLIDVFESDKKIGIVGCKLLFPNGKIQHTGGIINLSGGHNRGEGEKDAGQYDRIEFFNFVTGAVLMIKSSVIYKIGLLDEGFTPLYYEDVDWCVRARLCGYKVAYTPNPKLIHHCGSSANKLGQEKKMFYLRKNFIRFFLLNFQLEDILKRMIKFELRIAIGCLFMHTRDKKIPLALRSDASVRFSLFLKSWFPSICDLKYIITLRRQRFNLGAKLCF